METFQPKVILVATDFSKTAAHALRYASSLAARTGARRCHLRRRVHSIAGRGVDRGFAGTAPGW
jgi:hypothetical protein